MDKLKYLDLTPDPRVLNMLGEIPLKGHECIAELIDNAIDAMVFLEKENSRNTITIYLPSASELELDQQLTITDSGRGMTSEELNNAIRAGYSGKGSQDNLGLFGMGFNIATARLGSVAKVWTSTVNDEVDYGVVIDLLKMQKERSYKTQLLERHNSITSPRGKSGTTIIITKYKPEGRVLLRNRSNIIRKLKSVYSQSLFNKYNVELIVNGEKIEGKKFCIWNHKKEGRNAIYKGMKYLPYVEIKRKVLKSVPYCENCLTEVSWVGKNEKELPARCDNCGQEGTIFIKEYAVSGWLGIQRFFHSEDYGVDIVRNGRIIEEHVKEIFTWIPRESYNLSEDKIELLDKNGGVLPEYPIDNKQLGGRIVGEIYADFIKPNYTKNHFDRTEIWYDVLEIFRGRSPLQNEWAKTRMGMETNESPLSLLFHAYRKTEPGQANLVCGAAQGGANQGNNLAISYYRKFIMGDPEYKDDDKWYELVLAAESRTDIDEPEDVQGPDVEPEGEREIGVVSDKEKFSGIKNILGTLTFDLEREIDIKKVDVKIFEWFPDQLVFQPIIFIGISAKEWHFLINQNHNMVRDFPEGWEDLLLIEVAHRFASKVTDIEKWSITSIYYELKRKYFPERLLNVDTIFWEASNLVKDIIEYLVNNQFPIVGKLELTEEQEAVFREKYLQVEDEEIGSSKINGLIEDTGFLRYMDKNYIFNFLEKYPSLIFDGKFFSLPYLKINDESMRESRLNMYMGYFADIEWILSTLPDVTKATMRSNKANFIKAKLSLEELNSRRA